MCARCNCAGQASVQDGPQQAVLLARLLQQEILSAAVHRPSRKGLLHHYCAMKATTASMLCQLLQALKFALRWGGPAQHRGRACAVLLSAHCLGSYSCVLPCRWGGPAQHRGWASAMLLSAQRTV